MLDSFFDFISHDTSEPDRKKSVLIKTVLSVILVSIAGICVYFFLPMGEDVQYKEEMDCSEDENGLRRLEEVLATMQRAVANNDKEMVASMIQFPLTREYPLDDITDKEDFIKYYDTLFDDSLRLFISRLDTNDLWTDNLLCYYHFENDKVEGEIAFDMDYKIAEISYLSSVEKTMIKDFLPKESYGLYEKSKGIPFCCYLSEDSLYVLRIEKIFEDEIGETYRAFLYEHQDYTQTLYNQPLFVGYGNIAFEGSGQFTVMDFVDAYYSKRISITGGGYGDYHDIEAYMQDVPCKYDKKETISFTKYTWRMLINWWH